MPRRPRRAQWTDAACYHVMNRGQTRATIFSDDPLGWEQPNPGPQAGVFPPNPGKWDGVSAPTSL